MTTKHKIVLHMAAGRTEDDFGQPITRLPGEVLYDAPTVPDRQWALMTEASWSHHRYYNSFAAGRGQKYQLNADGEYVKVAG